ncbi:ATP-binding protein [Candidatus Phytoplasma fraxini]|uniref:ATP-binding protein n=1 Tax=Ash yellows phytoplasma TaxID=35780 RepID=UPI0030FEF5E5
MEKEKETLTRFKDFLTNPQKAKEYGFKAPTGVLLYGEPETGKTVLAQGLAEETNFPFIQVGGSSFSSHYRGDTVQKARELFKKARELAPCIVFIDECEMALAEMDTVQESVEIINVVNAFKEELTSVKNNSDTPIFFIRVTNHYDKINEAIKNRINYLFKS